MKDFTLVSPTAERTRALGALLARAIRRTDIRGALVIAFNGELGAGKTTFIAGALAEFGVTGAVRSPTYTLIEPYELGERSVYHLDLYRLSEPRELEMLALRDLLAPGAVLFVEWAERGARELPTPDLTIDFRYRAAAEGRELGVAWGTMIGKELAQSLHALADEASLSL